MKVRHNYIKYILSVTNYCFFTNPDGGKNTTGIVVGVILGVIFVVMLSSNDDEKLHNGNKHIHEYLTHPLRKRSISFDTLYFINESLYIF